jgi:membrane protease YdiL (CAAX protease family)
MKSETISALLLSILIGLCASAGALFIHNPGSGIFLFNVCFFFAAFLAGFGIDRHRILIFRQIWSLESIHRRILWVSLGMAAGLGFLDRYLEGLDVFPGRLDWFVLVSMLIGATEEIIFRGVIQGEASRWNTRGAVMLSAFFFALYKTLIFIWPGEFNQANPWILFPVTFVAGILLGYTRKATNSLLPAILAHMLFDLILYADSAKAPWWVWE